MTQTIFISLVSGISYMTSICDYIKKRVSLFIITLFAFQCLILVSCINKSNDSSESVISKDDIKYEDGKYCANVNYYNSNTGTTRTYTLNVEVEDKELIKIYWPNGGWLDDSHFRPPEIDKDGSCSFTTDKGYQYTIEITGPECSSTSARVVLEGNDEPGEFTLTLEQCASTMKMTEKELVEYEENFNVSRADIINEKMCNLMFEYIQKHRELSIEKNSFDQLLENGYIQKKYFIGSEDNILCQTIIVKRKGYYYLMEVQGTRMATMGLMDFDPSISGWQDVKILENPNKPVWQVFVMKVIDKSAEMSSLTQEMEVFCSN